MIYNLLELRGYERMSLNDIEYFSIAPTKPLQLILGTNGSGKSSMMSEMTPLPANPKEYTPEGSKKVSITASGHFYTATSTFAPKTEHSFTKDGIELNPGKTASVQKELCRQEFGITTETHELGTSIIKFSTMSTADRRYWFTKLSDTSYDYALKVYNKLRERSRDVSGSLKLAKKRLVTEMSKVIGEEEKTNLVDQITDLHRVLQEMMEYRQPLNRTSAELEIKASKIERELITLSRGLIKSKIAMNGKYPYLSMEEITQALTSMEADGLLYTRLMEKYIEDHHKLQGTIDILKQKGDSSIEELKAKIDVLNESKEELRTGKKLDLFFLEPIQASQALETVYETLTTVSAGIPVNKGNQFSREAMVAISERGIAIKNKLASFTNELNKLSAQKEHQELHKSKDLTECPKCHHAWAVGFSEALYEELCTRIELLQNGIDELTTELAANQEDKEAIDNYVTFFRQYSSCKDNWPILEPLWSYLFSNKILREEPRSLQGILERLRYDLKLDIKAVEIDNEKTNILNILKLAEQVGTDDILRVQTQQTELETLIEETTEKQSANQTALKKLSTYKREIENMIELSERIDILSTTFNSTYNEHRIVLRNSAIADMIRSVQLILAKKEQLLSEINMQQGIIKDIEGQIAILETEEVAYKLLVKELSPTEGLIAEGLLGFISTFTRHMNAFIKRIWTYKLEVIPCGLESDGSIELDYKFPVKVGEKRAPTVDVSRGSSGMREVIDLAFMVTAMKYLGLADIPLFLDEFAKTMDSAHRVAAMRAVQELMETSSFSQLFMISHYEESYGSLVNAELCVLHDANIVIPKDAVINRHVRIN